MAGDDDDDGVISPIKAIKKITRDTRTRGFAFAQILQANLSSMQNNLAKIDKGNDKKNVQLEHVEHAIKAQQKAQADIVDISYGLKSSQAQDVTYKSKIKRNKEIFDPYNAYAQNQNQKPSSPPFFIDESKIVDAVIVEDESTLEQDQDKLDTKKY